MSDFDLAQHQRQRIARLERDNKALHEVRRRLERLCAIAVTAAAGKDCDPKALLRVIEYMDEEAQKGRSYAELAQLLRETAPTVTLPSSDEGQKQEVHA